MSVSGDDFPAFFAELNGGHDPFSWQRRLAERLARTGRWPEQLVAPTGAGKTSCIDIHVFAVAATVHAPDAVRPPRRLAMVVDRRALTDDQYERALRIDRRLRRAMGQQGIVGEVARALAQLRELDGSTSMNDGSGPLVVARLRGGAPPSRRWREEPASCAVICATPDMWGSRLLFRGYGTSRRALGREAGLLALDAAVVVDEAHLSRQLLATARRVGELQRAAESGPDLGVLQVVETTATPRSGGADAVGVEDADLERDPALRRRLMTPKPVELLPLEDWPVPRSGSGRRRGLQALADAAQRLRSECGATVGCFVNSVDAAIGVATLLREAGVASEVVNGRRRPADVEALRQRRPGLLDIRGNPKVDVLVSTQSLEVGVDLDLRGLVTELAPGPAIAQRAGRVDRLGDHGDARIVVAVPAAPMGDDATSGPYRADELRASLQWLEALAPDPAGLSPWNVRTSPPPVPERLRITPRLEPWDTWVLAQTSVPLFAEPALELWISDDLEPDLDVGVVLRDGLTDDSARNIALVTALPPTREETFPVSIRTARSLLERLDARVPGVVVGADDAVALGEDPTLRPGDLVVLSTAAPVLRGGVVVEDATDGGEDICELSSHRVDRAGVRTIGRAHLRLQRSKDEQERRAWPVPLERILGSTRSNALLGAVAQLDLDTRGGRHDLARLLGDEAVRLDPPWSEHLKAVVALLRERLSNAHVLPLHDVDGVLTDVVITDARRQLADTARLQTRGADDGIVTLGAHQAAVAQRVRVLAESLGFTAPDVAVLEHAARHHDDGKADPRFQRLLGAGDGNGDGNGDAEILAKSGHTTQRQRDEAAAASGLPSRWRHEQLSAARNHRVEGVSAGPAQDLATRLVGTTHGWGRNTFPHAADELVLTDSPDADDVERLFGDGLWEEIVESTNHVHGPWGAAYLEAVLQAADHQVSGEGR